MALLPYVSESGEIIDGVFFRLLPFCNKHCMGEKCRSFYNGLQEAEAGAHCCPYGLSSYVYVSPQGKFIFTGLKIKGVYNKKKARITEAQEFTYSPIIDEKTCASIAQEISVSLWERKSLEEKLDAIRDLLHETRSLNGQIKNSIDLLWETNIDENNINHDTMIDTLKKAHVSSFMISNRFSYFDSVLNPTLSIGNAYPAVVFKKFDKMRKILKNYLRKNVWITIESPNPSNYRYNIYPTFETLLFILLENAIKYSPNNKPVEVVFKEEGQILDVTIQSVGPYCDENEMLHLCDKGFRGKNAVMTQETGQGFGLNFAKNICDSHNIKLSFKCSYLYQDHGVKYGNFLALLHFESNA